MKKKIRVLIIEDSEDDRELLLMALKQGGYDPFYKCIQTGLELENALVEDSWDVILSDYSMPEFDGLSALQIIKNKDLDIPFILVSGAIGEDLAVEIMREGAKDYLLKDNLSRLIPAIKREIDQANNRKKHRKAENHRLRLLKVVQKSLNEIYLFNSETLKIEYANESALQNLDYEIHEIKQYTPIDLNTKFTAKSYSDLLAPLVNGVKEKIVYNTYHKRKNGTQYPVEVHLQLIKEGDRSYFAAISLDLTTRNKDARIIEKQKIQTEELALSSKYKSEFLANMSHELRTPLNSIILLSDLLINNQSENLTEPQIDYLKVIYSSGNNLHELINDILDISKIEAGEMSMHIASVKVSDLCTDIFKTFEPLADKKGLKFILNKEIDNNLVIKTDRLRIEQIIKNFLSNAFKFTNKGSVTLSVYQPKTKEIRNLNTENNNLIAFRVIDTGIGIPDDKKELIFEAFQQADGSSQRRYGGTGLGLSISKQLTEYLGGEITLDSTAGTGSIFTVYVPEDSSFCDTKRVNSKVITGEEIIHKSTGKKDLVPLKNSYSANKPNDQKTLKQILLVDDSEIHLSALKELIDGDEKLCVTARTAKETYNKLKTYSIDLMVIDLGLPDEDGFDVIKTLRADKEYQHLPIIVYTGRYLTDKIKNKYHHVVQHFITKTSGSYKILNTLINKSLGIGKDQINAALSYQNHVLTGKKVLIVDDDERNIYSLSRTLEAYQMLISTASNGKEALKILDEQDNFDVILMDLMMPVMNGFDAISKIRKNPAWKELPIFAITAKAMAGDKEKCIRAGATKYLSKPVQIEKLISFLQSEFR